MFTEGGHVKPLFSPYINWAHPFARNLIFMVPATDPVFSLNSSADAGRKPLVIWGKGRQQALPNQGGLSVTALGSNAAGRCLDFSTSSFVQFPTGDYVASDRVTVLLIRRKHDTTLRSSCAFGFSGSGNASRCGCHLPWSDGHVYWQFGGAGGSAGDMDYATYTPTTNVEKWAFTAGKYGQAIYLNGKKVMSSSTAVSRTTDNSMYFALNNGHAVPVGDVQDFNFFQLIDEQWSDAMVYAWMAQPYAHLYVPSLDEVAAAAAGSTPTVLTVSVSESVGVSESASYATSPTLRATVAETITVTDAATAIFPNLSARVSDTISVADATALSVATALRRTVSDAISVADVPHVSASLTVRVFESITVTNNLSRRIPGILSPSTILTGKGPKGSRTAPGVRDLITVRDVVTARLYVNGGLAVRVYETITVGENNFFAGLATVPGGGGVSDPGTGTVGPDPGGITGLGTDYWESGV